MPKNLLSKLKMGDDGMTDHEREARISAREWARREQQEKQDELREKIKEEKTDPAPLPEPANKDEPAEVGSDRYNKWLTGLDLAKETLSKDQQNLKIWKDIGFRTGEDVSEHIKLYEKLIKRHEEAIEEFTRRIKKSNPKWEEK